MSDHLKPIFEPLAENPDPEEQRHATNGNSRETGPLRLSDYKIEPIQPAFDHTELPASPLPHEDVPEGYDLFVKTMQAMEERYPFQVAVLQFQALNRVLQLACEEERLHTLDEEDYSLMLQLLDGLEELTRGCEACPPKGPGAHCGSCSPLL